MNRRRLAIVLLLVIAPGAGFWQGNRLVRRQAVALQHIPATPILTAWPASFTESLTEAEVETRTLRHAVPGLIKLSRLYHANGFYAEAMICYQGLQEAEPAHARWPHLRAGIVANFGRLDEALPLREQAVRLDPDYIPARLRLGDVLLKLNQIPAAAQTYAEVLRRTPGEPYALLGLARCAIATSDWHKANEHLQAALAQHPDFVGALSLLVTVSERLGNSGAAESYRTVVNSRIFTDLPDPWLDELSDVCFDPYLLSIAAATANYAGNRSTALALIDRAIALAPDSSTYRRQAGQFLLDDRNYSAAKAQFERVVAITPTDPDAWLRLIEALRGLGQEQAAVSSLLTGLSHCPQSPSLHLEYARWLKANNRLDEAIAEFRYGYQLRPSEASPLVELATAYVAAGKNREAVDALNLALERQPGHPMALVSLVFIAIGSNDEAEARRQWEQVRRQSNTPAAAVNSLRQAYQQQFGRTLP